MPELNFQVESVQPQRNAASPTLLFKLRIREASAAPTPIHGIVLRCQIRIEPGRRRYSAAEQHRLRDVFDVPDRWGQTLRPFPWTQLGVMVAAFRGDIVVDLPVACSQDFCLAATKYFDALENGDIPLCFLFSGSIFYQTDTQPLQVGQIPWEKEASFRLPAAMWLGIMDLYYPNNVWLRLGKDSFDRLNDYRSRYGLPTCEQALERLLSAAEETMNS